MPIEPVISWFLVLTTVLLGAAVLTGLLLLTLWLLFNIAWLLANQLPAHFRWQLLRRLFRLRWLPEKAEVEENSSAERNHRSIGDWVAQTVGRESANDFPAAFIHRFSLLRHGQAPPDPWQEKPEVGPLDNLVYRLLVLSQTIRDDTAIFWARRRKGYRRVQAATWVTITIGLITTILVSLRSTEFGAGSTTAAHAIQILAIVFPALGTAAAAIIGFYGFADVTGRASYALTSLRQLHGQMALGIWSLDPASARADDGKFHTMLGELLKEWEKRYIDVKDVAEAEAPGGNSDKSPTRGGNSEKSLTSGGSRDRSVKPPVKPPSPGQSSASAAIGGARTPL